VKFNYCGKETFRGIMNNWLVCFLDYVASGSRPNWIGSILEYAVALVSTELTNVAKSYSRYTWTVSNSVFGYLGSIVL
jgi:hypothetical protein